MSLKPSLKPQTASQTGTLRLKPEHLFHSRERRKANEINWLGDLDSNQD
jgi:hypothetical protein